MVVHRHIDQLKFRHADTDIELDDFRRSSPVPEMPSSDHLVSVPDDDSLEVDATPVAARPAATVPSEPETLPQASSDVVTSVPEPVQVRRSGRERTANI